MSSVRIFVDDKEINTTAQAGINILSLLQSEGAFVFAPCGGNGQCGKCKVKIRYADKVDTVLACRSVIEDDCTIYADTTTGGKIQHESAVNIAFAGKTGYGVACDIGTTTVVISLYNLSTGQQVDSVAQWNNQAVYGADVITRCQYIIENGDGLEKECNAIQNQVTDNIMHLANSNDIDIKSIKELYISGNTIMQHIFAGISPRAIAVAPYTPQTLFDEAIDFTIDKLPDTKVHFAPCVSGYVGGDITAGMLASGLDNNIGITLFMDIGTNGEMAIGDKDGYICCSVATGPAFEGAQITCGMPSINGAVSHIKYENNNFIYDVIGGGKPLGLCGSAIVDLIAILLKQGVVDDTGRLLAPDEVPDLMAEYIEEDEDGNGTFYLSKADNIYFTAKDLRKIQLAKAAVMAGISTLTAEKGIAYSDISQVFVAGGFGTNLDCYNGAVIGMFPQEIADKIKCLGNTSLQGAVMAMMSAEQEEKMHEIQKKCRYIELAESAKFRDEYIEQMIFENSEVEY